MPDYFVHCHCFTNRHVCAFSLKVAVKKGGRNFVIIRDDCLLCKISGHVPFSSSIVTGYFAYVVVFMWCVNSAVFHNAMLFAQ